MCELKIEFAAKVWLPLVHEIERKIVAEFSDVAKLTSSIELRLQLPIAKCVTRRYNVNTCLRLI